MAEKWHGGKGDKPRKVDSEKFGNNWDKIFGKDSSKEKSKQKI
jgi:hypothetical protein